MRRGVASLIAAASRASSGHTGGDAPLYAVALSPFRAALLSAIGCNPAADVSFDGSATVKWRDVQSAASAVAHGICGGHIHSLLRHRHAMACAAKGDAAVAAFDHVDGTEERLQSMFGGTDEDGRSPRYSPADALEDAAAKHTTDIVVSSLLSQAGLSTAKKARTGGLSALHTAQPVSAVAANAVAAVSAASQLALAKGVVRVDVSHVQRFALANFDPASGAYPALAGTP